MHNKKVLCLRKITEKTYFPWKSSLTMMPWYHFNEKWFWFLTILFPLKLTRMKISLLCWEPKEKYLRERKLQLHMFLQLRVSLTDSWNYTTNGILNVNAPDVWTQQNLVHFSLLWNAKSAVKVLSYLKISMLDQLGDAGEIQKEIE